MESNVRYVYDKHGIANAYVEENREKYRVRVETDMLNSRFYSINDIVLCKEHRKMLKDYFRRRN